MKRLFYIIIFTVFLASDVWAAGSCVESGTNPTYIYSGNYKAGEIVTLLCTHHTDNSLSAAVAASTMAKLAGKYVSFVKSYPGTTAPTDNTDLSIVDSDGLSLMGTADNGANFIDATSTLATRLYNASLTESIDDWMPVAGEAWTISTANNAVASATFYLKFYLMPQK